MRHEHQSADLFAPLLELLPQLGGLLGHLRGQVLRLAEVGLEIIEFGAVFLEELDELPVARAERAAGRPGGAVVMRVMPEKRVARWRLLAPQNRDDADAIAMLLRSRGESGEFEQCKPA